MNENQPSKFNITSVFLTLLALCLALFSQAVSAATPEDTERFIAKLQEHYAHTRSIKAFSSTVRYLGRKNPYQSWDFKSPNRYKAFKVTDIDLQRKHYAQHAVQFFTGGLIDDQFHFQNDSESLRYDINGYAYGKRIVNQSMEGFERFKRINMMNFDFLAIRPLLEEQEIITKITIKKNTDLNQSTVVHQSSKDNLIEYQFNDAPLRLLSIHDQTRNRIYEYHDYQTTNGVTFARTLHNYYGGHVEPSFVKSIEGFSILEKIDETKLRLPPGYGPIIPEGDNSLFSKEIAPNLYLVTSEQAWRNILFTVNDNEISVFGAPLSKGHAEEVIQLIGKEFPTKKITSIYVTLPYSDHIAGLPAYAERGITIRADIYTISAIKAYPRFAKEIDSFIFEPIEHNQVIDSVQFFVLESTRSKRQSFTYFENSGVIYQSDFLEIPYDNSIPKVVPSYSKTFIDFVRDSKLDVKRIVGHHRNNNITPEVMNKACDAIVN